MSKEKIKSVEYSKIKTIQEYWNIKHIPEIKYKKSKGIILMIIGTPLRYLKKNIFERKM